ncbi:MAG: hypothetical protein COZ34_04980 [Candidatus Pacebacteria bacterium CG_4_10_14_3_um_filter_34_15]|nr:DUF4258 domain-containing protein [Candidatus Pacearchaeota archaeon]NCQ65870.1 DUF4258 domain-containing protein [Candidatus Paceibacterota bacterium]OIO44807.1 MAG: hypothetical protein AUJ41_01735 [Candidatus Pacebacteria bacterium CG1_02_43_31]PIQ81428.1 MAG: hypothetical protein COV78_00270 [Candidatus Pacebacteria bacterium CG11_big_fil_rev_8_21_14_0_20_34_55]PIX81140.1 MAG: hypothetical protein COZ34_04980 [Candidatus Pacebacteria bacterium CG_4_10_14_3_um_filter_34_15]PJC43538.1 MAG
MPDTYKNIIFTKHAIERMNKRSISKDKIWQVINHPDKTFNESSSNEKGVTKKFIKETGDRKYQVIATYLPNEQKHLVISTWVRGEDDKQSIIWLIITLPFKIIWWLIKKLFSKSVH